MSYKYAIGLQDIMAPFMAAKGSIEGGNSFDDLRINPDTLTPDKNYLQTNLIRSAAQPFVDYSGKYIANDPKKNAIFDSIRQNAQLRSKVLTGNPLVEKLYKDFENSVFANRFVNTKQQTLGTIVSAQNAIKQKALEEARDAELYSAFMDEYARQSRFRKEIIKPEHIYEGMIARGFQDVGKISPEIAQIINMSNKKKVSPLISSNPNALKIKANLVAAQEKALAAQDLAQTYSGAEQQMSDLLNRAKEVDYTPSSAGPRINILKFRENMRRMNDMKSQFSKGSTLESVILSLMLKRATGSALKDIVDAKLSKLASYDEFGIVPSSSKFDKSLSYDVGTSKIFRRRNLDLSEHMTNKIKQILESSNYASFPGLDPIQPDDSKDLFAVLAELKENV